MLIAKQPTLISFVLLRRCSWMSTKGKAGARLCGGLNGFLKGEFNNPQKSSHGVDARELLL